MLPGNSISDAVSDHVATMLEEGKNNSTVLYNMKVGELLSLACERAFITPGGSVEDQVRHVAEWEGMLLDTAKELSDLSQKIALSVTSADLVAQELQSCRKRERESRLKEPRAGRSFHSTPFRPPPVIGSQEDEMASEALQSVGMVHGAPPVAKVVSKPRSRPKRRR